MGDHVRVVPGAGHLSRCVTCHPGQLSLAILLWVGAMSTSHRAVMPCGWGVKAGVVRVWSIQPGHPILGRHNEYQPKGGDALRLGSKGRYGSCVGGR